MALQQDIRGGGQPDTEGGRDGGLDAIVVGAGFAGLYMLYRLRGLGFRVRVLEAADDVGGTWYWNRYPGARCDIESLEYQYGFDDDLAREWEWTERYASQPEILRYINHVADRFDLRRDILFNTRVTSARYDEAAMRWAVETEEGGRYDAQFCIMATGCLSAPRRPDFAGLDSFQGDWYHTGYWPHEGVDFTGKTVGIIGTGSSAIQSIPLIARQASHLTVFQRTPNFSVPAHNGPIDPEYRRELTERYTETRRRAHESHGGVVSRPPSDRSALAVTEEERRQEYESRWQQGGFAIGAAFNDLALNRDANETAAEFVRNKIREIVKDPATAEILCPRDYPFATKRLCVDTDYFATFNRENVTLVDVKRSPIIEVTASGLRTQDAAYAFDCLVFATGFDAMTGALLAVDPVGRGGRALSDAWSAGPKTYLGLQVVGFPNLFTITGPGSPSVLTNMLVAIEQHVDWVADCMAYMRDHHIAVIEAEEAAQDAWVEHVNMVANFTLFPQANSWYIGANIPGKPRVFMPYVGGIPLYEQKCRDVVANGYEGFHLGARRGQPAAN
ncbi:MAG: NAD(P)/FAD-dependent oxidoreductase [Chloroflexi bacterium]|nr:NAD(P)/FAD-dependent oxidoreductase [Chloroflexota bacterium]